MMSLKPFFRISGFALVLACFLFFVDIALHAPNSEVNAMLESKWKYAHIAEGLAYLCIALGSVGLYLRQLNRLSILGLTGFVVAFIGAVHTTSVGLIYHAYLLPFMANSYGIPLSPNDWYAASGPLGAEVAFVSQLALLAQVGFILWCIDSIRSGIFPRWLVSIFAVSHALGFISFFVPSLMETPVFFAIAIGFIAINLCYLAFGVMLITNKGFRQPIPESELALAGSKL